MLRQPRPKSQPPIKFTSSSSGQLISSKQHLGALGLGKLLQPQVPQMSPRGCLGSSKDSAMEQLQKDQMDLSSASSSSSDSSASSLASSTLSLSTDSSTSTVLAALSSIKQQQQKKLTVAKTQEEASVMPIQQQQVSKRQQSSEEEEETDQAISSASSSASSSGLSSMNSLSQTSPQSEDSSQLNSIEEAGEEEQQEEAARSEQVRQCLNDLVAEVSQQAKVESMKLQPNFEGLHGAILATTSQHTTSGSSDEEFGFADHSYSCGKDFAEAHLVKSFNVNDLLSDSLLLHLARQCVVSQTSPGSRWLVRLTPDKLTLEWASRGTNKLEALPLDRIVKHLVDGPLIVWLIEGAGTVELETTLDDIAMALDEPVDRPERTPTQLEVLVWLCCDERVASRISESFNSLKHSIKRETNVLYHNNSHLEQHDNYMQTTATQDSTNTDLSDSHSVAKKRSETGYPLTITTSSKVNRLSIGKLKDSNCSLGEQLDKAVVKEKVSHKKTTDMAAFGRASYYKSVASRVLSNGQHKIRSLRDEVIKFNRHSSNLSLNGSGLTNGSGRRSSRLINGKDVDHPQGSDFHQSQKLSSCSNLSYCVGEFETMNQGRHSSLHLNSKSLNNSSSTTSCNQIPAVKPRTSILKRGDTRQTLVSTSDNVKSITGSSLLRRQNTLISTASSPVSVQSQSKRLPTNQLPKSILKNSKSVSNLAISELNNKSDSEQSNNKRVHRLQVVGGTTDSRGPHPPADLKKSASAYLEDKHKSSYSLASESVQFFDDEGNDSTGFLDDREDTDEFNIDSSEREQAFERIRRRASCYDVSRLMSKSNSIESQLTKLRSGSTSSISGKSRQRRPALLLGESERNSANYLESNNDYTKQTTSVKGRAYGGTSNEASIQGGRRQLKLRQQEASAVSGRSQEFLAESKLDKKSEFDPRSLRRIKPSTGESAVRDVRQLLEIQAFKRQATLESSSNDNTNVTKPQTRAELKATKKVVTTIEKSIPSEVDESGENKSEKSHKAEEVEVDEKDHQTMSSSSLSKKGPFSLLRQSFNQKTISSMLKFSSRASMRWKPTEGVAVAVTEVDKVKRSSVEEAVASNKSEQTASAIAQAEANLIAARQLKQQAQKLKEQEKRELQMQQQQAAEHRSLMLAAVQYNQQMQQQQQQQQLVYQQAAQQYARAQMFDSTGLRFQHQMMFQRQQQQVAFLSPAQQYMVAQQQLAMMQQHQPILCQAGLGAPTGIDLFRSGAIRGTHKLPTGMHPAVQQQQQQQAHPLLPMSVNHHSSFNIVYAGGHNTLPPVAQPVVADEPVVVSSNRNKQSSLGQSMRKTVRSILSTKTQAGRLAPKAAQVESKEIKSPLKPVASSRDLNSEGSDGDTGSSSDSASTSHKPSPGSLPVTVPKSALKKSSNHMGHVDELSTSYKSTTQGATLHLPALSTSKQQAQGVKYRQSIHLNYDEDVNLAEGSSFSGSGSDSNGSNSSGKTGAGKSRRKNVTFSTKLTSIQ